ncbi:MAG: alpha/beta fold hydrolase [Dehalococcoidia bacterium]|nr:alpha/beta fold hydrolase [Dehalococcoidia bacterium]
MPHIETADGIRIRYEERGAGRPLVLAHGFGVSHAMWLPQLLALSESYRLITWDARGHGESSAPGHAEAYTMPLLASDLRSLLEGIGAIEGALIGGMSFGGQIALQYAVEYPSDTYALLLSDSTTRGPEPPRNPRDAAAAWGVAGDPGLEGGLRAMAERPDLTPLLPGLAMPALVMYGEHDELIGRSVQRVIDGLPRRRVTVLAECFHGTSAQRPSAWNTAVLRFLLDVEAGHELNDEEFV